MLVRDGLPAEIIPQGSIDPLNDGTYLDLLIAEADRDSLAEALPPSRVEPWPSVILGDESPSAKTLVASFTSIDESERCGVGVYSYGPGIRPIVGRTEVRLPETDEFIVRLQSFCDPDLPIK